MFPGSNMDSNAGASSAKDSCTGPFCLGQGGGMGGAMGGAMSGGGASGCQGPFCMAGGMMGGGSGGMMGGASGGVGGMRILFFFLVKYKQHK